MIKQHISGFCGHWHGSVAYSSAWGFKVSYLSGKTAMKDKQEDENANWFMLIVSIVISFMALALSLDKPDKGQKATPQKAIAISSAPGKNRQAP